jgi:hypothetical protein
MLIIDGSMISANPELIHHFLSQQFAERAMDQFLWLLKRILIFHAKLMVYNKSLLFFSKYPILKLITYFGVQPTT